MMKTDGTMLILAGSIVGLLIAASVAGALLSRVVQSEQARRTIDNLKARIRAWWIMVALFALAVAGGLAGVCVLFALISFLALREMLTLTPTRRADPHAMFWALFVMVPVQYYLIYIGWYGLYSIFIPVYGFLFLALTGDTSRYLERTAKIQWGVMICIYCVSYAPALMTLNFANGNASWKALVFLVVVLHHILILG